MPWASTSLSRGSSTQRGSKANHAGKTAGLAAIPWIVASYIHRSDRRISRAVMTVLETWLILELYTSAVIIWRQHWMPAKGMSEDEAFAALRMLWGIQMRSLSSD